MLLFVEEVFESIERRLPPPAVRLEPRVQCPKPVEVDRIHAHGTDWF